ncbi:MAG: stage III sporulation protein AB [Clostridia bacterium]|nr:stage III sporulation protein AB [Clostridia bacterium]
MKIVLIIVLISVVMLIAFSVSEQYKEKFDFYANLNLFLQKFKLNLSFKQETLKNFLNTCKPKKQFKKFVEDYKLYLATNKVDLSNITVLSDEEKAELTNIILNIGKLDTATETKQIDSFLLTLDATLKKAEEDKRKLCPMIIKLSLLFAVGLAIILI